MTNIYFSSKIVYLVSRNCECVHAQLLQSCLTFCNPMDYGPPGSSVRGNYLVFLQWSGLPFSSPEDLRDPGIEPTSPELQADSLLLSHQRSRVAVNTTILNQNYKFPY